jgi:hypothetical protein
MFFLGDCHGRFETYNWILNKMQSPGKSPQAKGLDCSFQLGDMGIFWDIEQFPDISMQHRFIRGNHDNPELCRTIPNCLPDWGYDEHTEIFWVSGGFSIDAAERQRKFKRKEVKAPIWWPDEEIKKEEHKKIRKAYVEAEPKILVSHAGPPAVKCMIPHLHPRKRIDSDTDGLLHDLWCMYPPDLWICGHYHYKAEWNTGKTDFVVLNEMINCRSIKEVIFEVPGLKWKTNSED